MSALPTHVSSPAATPGARADLVAGFQVFLIALPLCLGIAMASSFPPVAGLISAIVGGLLATWLGSAPLTIKGPAAGLIVIALGAVSELGHGDNARGYRLSLACITVAGGLQVLLALARAGRLGAIFPASVVHGMLAAIGVIIVSKQAHQLVGVVPHAKEPLHLLAEIPRSLSTLNPEVAIIGFVALAIMLGMPKVAVRVPALRRVPPPFVVLLVAVPMGLWFDLAHQHTYTFALDHHRYPLGPQFLVNLPASLLAAVTFPDFSQITSGTSIKYVVMFTLVGSIESLLTAKAVDLLDPQRRANDLDKDLLATGLGNLVAGMLGGLPMISEILRSSANISYGAQSRKANFFHGLFLLVAVAFIPGLIHRVPLAALAAMLITAGIRLASPGEFRRTLNIGVDQLALFLVTLGVTVATDLLVGIAAGIALKVALHLGRGASVRGLFKPAVEATRRDDTLTVRVRDAAVFTGFLSVRRHLVESDARRVVIDLGDTCLVDHTVLEALHQLGTEFERGGREMHIEGLQHLTPSSTHPLAVHRKVATAVPSRESALG